MSLVLAPIHFKMYEKMKTQEAMTQEILKIRDVSASLNETYASLEEGDLADLIDQSNIHGWLADTIDLVESRFAFAVSTVLKEAPETMEAMRQAMYELGKQYAVPSAATADFAMEEILGTLLNGMPCDMVIQPQKDSQEEASWELLTDIHAFYWRNGADVSVFYDLRDQFVRGMLADTSLSYEVEGRVYTICK